MLNAMSQGRSGSMCTIHADSSSGIFTRLASYAVQAPERLPLESTNLLIAGAVHFAVFVEMADARRAQHASGRPAAAGRASDRFEAIQRRRLVTSVREVVGAEGLQVLSNEILRRGRDGSVVPSTPLRTDTLEELVAVGFEPQVDRWSGPW